VCPGPGDGMGAMLVCGRGAEGGGDWKVLLVLPALHCCPLLLFSLQYDSVHGTFAGAVSGDDTAKELTIDGRKIKVRPGSCVAFSRLLARALGGCTRTLNSRVMYSRPQPCPAYSVFSRAHAHPAPCPCLTMCCLLSTTTRPSPPSSGFR
jgi:hypothetical protein